MPGPVFPFVCTVDYCGAEKRGGSPLVVIPQPGVPGERSLLAGVERSGGICFSNG